MNEIAMTLDDRRTFKAKLIGCNELTDIKLLEIESDRLASLAFGDCDALTVGHFVVAAENPFGLTQTVRSTEELKRMLEGVGRVLALDARRPQVAFTTMSCSTSPTIATRSAALDICR